MQGKIPEKTERINLRVSPEEKEILTMAAASAGLSLSAYLLGDKLGQMIMSGFASSSNKKNTKEKK